MKRFKQAFHDVNGLIGLLGASEQYTENKNHMLVSTV